MTQEDKQLLMKDLCARLPYGIVVNAQYKDGEGWKIEDKSLKGIYSNEQVYLNCVYTTIDNIKPYLRPMTSMTEEELHEIQEILGKGVEIREDFILSVDSSINSFTYLELIAVFDWLNAHHFDYTGLIKRGLALEALEGMYNN